MNKYIQDTIRNNLRCIISDFKRPQQKAISEIVRGLFVVQEPILHHIVQNKDISVKKQAEKYSYHLGKMCLKGKVERYAFKASKNSVNKKTIIAYDLTDISKESSKKIEKLSRVFDGSKRKITNGYTLHGVGINNILVKFEIHDHDKQTLNQTRIKIVKNISEQLNKDGIWVFDRGNDDKQFFKDLRQNLKVNFIARLKENRQLVLKETGVKIKVKNLSSGKYPVYFMNRNNNKVDTEYSYTLIISKHLEDKEPIRLISSLDIDEFSEKEFVTMYLERWGVENIFKRVKVKFNLEKIRVLSFKKFENLVLLIQFTVIVSTIIFQNLQKINNQLIAPVLFLYKHFIKHKSLSFNIDSFIAYLKESLPQLITRCHHPTNQLQIFNPSTLQKLGCS